MDQNSASQSDATIHAMRRRSCSKLHRVKELPRDSSGRLALFFRFTCLGCGLTEVSYLQDIIACPVSETSARNEPHAHLAIPLP